MGGGGSGGCRPQMNLQIGNGMKMYNAYQGYKAGQIGAYKGGKEGGKSRVLSRGQVWLVMGSNPQCHIRVVACQWMFHTSL